MTQTCFKLRPFRTGFGSDRRGAILPFVAIAVIPVLAAVGLAIDAARGFMIKERLAFALDAGALAAARVIGTANMQEDFLKYFNANFPPGFMGAQLTGPNIVVSADNRTVSVDASATVDSTFMKIAGVPDFDVSANSEVTLNSVNIEVALVLDTTGSMDGQRIVDLRAAAKDLIDLVVQDVQTPYYSKVALVPYSMGVNVGGYADEIRGPVAAPVKSITGATRDDPVVITAPAHGFSNGDVVRITGVNGMTELNNKEFTVTNATTNKFALWHVDGDYYDKYTSGGSAEKVCTTPDCRLYRYTNMYWYPVVREISTCVSERTGANAYTDVAPSVAYVGKNYPSDGNPCLPHTIVPLSSDKVSLHAAVEDLEPSGSTAGHIGVAWGWYMLSPSFAYLWPADSQPDAYGAPELKKVAIIMTDGEFNTTYCQGAISQSSTSGSGSASDKINCSAPNGSSLGQGEALCDAMKAAGIEVYTVGFDIDGAAEDFVEDCASDEAHVYLPASGGELQQAFTDIGMSVSKLRLSK